ncbi:type II secretion system GspH family protein [Candidatus Saccharibacteria bacterium]|nr:type II secretion system GspH family protein [Candidatus Saccharibacteria bacterium]
MKKQGFTIIEVVLVLAIAGLIFLMVFLALPTLQRNQRDTQRRNELGRVASQVQQFMGNNQGRIPANDGWNAFAAAYMRVGSDFFIDPNGQPFMFTVSSVQNQPTTLLRTMPCPANTVVDGQAFTDCVPIYVFHGAECHGEGVRSVAAGARRVAFRISLEGAGTYCVDNGAGGGA